MTHAESVAAQYALHVLDRTGRRAFAISCQTLGLAMGLAEVLLIAAVVICADAIHRGPTGMMADRSEMALGVGLLAGIIHAAAARSAGLYRLPVLVEPLPFARRHLSVCGTTLLSVTGVLFCMKAGAEFPRGTLAIVAFTLPLACGMGRLAAAPIVAALMRRGAVAGRPVFILGEERECAGLDAPYLLAHYGLREVGRLIFDLPGAPSAATLADAPSRAREGDAEAFLIAGAWRSADDLHAVERALAGSPLPIQLMPSKVLRSIIDREGLARDRSRHLVTLRHAPLSPLDRVSKRSFDLVLASLALALLVPILAVTALAIAIDSRGPVLFRQRRSGFDQRPFTILKFRTMAHSAPGCAQARRGDERVTRVGAFLRRSSLDELPQLLNVLRGDMSLVGPRPHALEHDSEYRALVGDYVLRHHVRPGITGWAQVSGQRGETAEPGRMARRVELDLWYIGNWSMLLDVTILCRTMLEVMRLDAY